MCPEKTTRWLTACHGLWQIHLGLDYSRMAADQTTDPHVQPLRTSTTGLKIEDVVFGNAGTTLCQNDNTKVTWSISANEQPLNKPSGLGQEDGPLAGPLMGTELHFEKRGPGMGC